MVSVIILAVCLLVVDMLNVISLVYSKGLSAYRVDVSKTFVFLTRCTPGKFVTRSLQNVFRKLLVFNYTNKDMDPHLVIRPTSLMSVKMLRRLGI